MPPFRLGLIGAGRMGRTHLRALAGSERVAVTAIAEMSAAARSAVDAPGVTVFASLGYGMMGKAHSYGYRVAPMLRPLPVTRWSP